ncbi:efflux RND transporter periplasmic adaptor subunit [Candidatus Uabimicrobium helgolandensis]
MDSLVDLAVQDLENLRPRMRSNLKFTFQIIKNVPCYVIEDPVNSRYYRVGVNEYKFLSLLNGKKSVAEAMRIMADTMAEDALLQNEVVQMLHWLGNVNLLETNKPQEIDDTWKLFGLSHGVSKLLFPKFPFGSPDKILSKILPLMRPLLGWGFFCVWIVCVVGALYLVLSQWDRFALTAGRVLSVNNWLHLAIVWCLLKVVHELWHALVCKYHGAGVRETGILFILFIPMGYVDTSSCWNLSSKWRRIHVAFAGMKIELLVAAVATFIWSETSVGLLNQVCYEIILMSSITTLFFNANPLMRFDGYYALADYIEEVNLYSRAQGYLQYLGKKYLLGVLCSFNEDSFKTRLFLFTYGLSALIWRILIYAGIALATSLLFLGAGIALSIVYIFVFAILPFVKLLKYMFIGNEMLRPALWRSVVLTSGLVYFVYAIFTTITWEKGLEASGVIVYKKQEIARVYCPGFVKKIYVDVGQSVRKGEKLLKLENRDADNEYMNLLLTIQETKLRIRQLQQEDLVATKIEKEKLLYLEKQRTEQKKLVDSLVIVSPIDGIVATRNITQLLGTYLAVGSEAVTIFDSKDKQFVIAIHQDDIDQYSVLLSKRDLVIYVPSLEKNFSGTLDKIHPTATTNILHPALAAIGGGNLPVQNDGEGNYQFVVPYFRAEISLSKHKDLKSGHRGYVRIYEQKKTIGMHLYFMIEDWIQDTWSQNS